MTVDEFFEGHPKSRRLFEAVRRKLDALGEAEVKVTKSQVAFRRRKAFAWVWRPGQYLRGQTAPLVLTLSFPARDPSPRWKEITPVAKGRYTHHLELRLVKEVDGQVKRWLTEAWEAAE